MMIALEGKTRGDGFQEWQWCSRPPCPVDGDWLTLLPICQVRGSTRPNQSRGHRMQRKLWEVNGNSRKEVEFSLGSFHRDKMK